MAILGLCGASAPAAAQEWRPAPGDRSLAFDLPAAVVIGPTRGPSGSGDPAARESSVGFGVWWQQSEMRALALELDAGVHLSRHTGSAALERTGTATSVAVGPALKWYRPAAGPVSPYLYAALRLGTSWNGRRSGTSQPPASSWAFHAAGRLGLGVDWFPLDRISVGGFTGGRLGYGYTGSGQVRHRRGQSLGLDLFTSGLKLHIYF